MLKRILASLILLFSILFLPFWFSVLLVLAGMIYFSFFFEAVFFMFISDLLYGTQEERFFNFIFVSFFISLIVLLLIEFLKKKIRF